MYIVASRHPDQVQTVEMALVAGIAMMLSCAIAGFLGSAMPLLIRKLGFNPAMAANLVMSGLSDIISLSLFLFMAVKFAV
jgi:magnesium transporter